MCNAWVSWNGELAVMHAHQPLGPPRQRGARHACEHHRVQHLYPCMYIHCCLAHWGICWFPQVMHAAVRFTCGVTRCLRRPQGHFIHSIIYIYITLLPMFTATPVMAIPVADSGCELTRLKREKASNRSLLTHKTKTSATVRRECSQLDPA